ncbi:DUF2726 domain-containing protein [Rossellomorea marisflavi]|uniref:DUF2726 domain-containing protein n=1 Tax=Rossellomorea marisflavi TaxID=189381 RepID=UPI00345DE7A3
MTKTNNEFVRQLKAKYGSEYLSWEKYVHGNKPMKFMHFVEGCRRFFYKQPELILRGQGCPCLKEHRKAEKYRKKLYTKYGDEYKLIGGYTLETDRVTILHNVQGCMKTYNPIARDFFRRDQTCPFCTGYKTSNGEHKIKTLLTDKNIKFEEQYSFKECVYKKQLRFDFALLGERDNVKCLIEFDGKQHFQAVNFFGGEEGFLMQQKRDGIKNNFCSGNSIPLYRIPYYEENNIEGIINDIVEGKESSNQYLINKIN